MPEYIERAVAFDAITDLAGKAPTRSAYETVWTSARVLKKIPVADVAPVVHGRWIQVDSTKCRCSHCDIIALIALYPHGDKNFCPNCGAKMDMEVED